MHDIKTKTEKNAPTSVAISMAMWISVGTVPSGPICHWTPPSGEYLSCIAPADALVIDFGVKNQVMAM